MIFFIVFDLVREYEKQQKHYFCDLTLKQSYIFYIVIYYENA